VASFIDAGAIVRGTSERRGSVIEVVSKDVRVKGPAPSWLTGTHSAAAVLVPDRVHVERSGANDDTLSDAGDMARGEVQRVVFTGSMYNVYVRIGGDLELRSAITLSDAARLGEALSVGSQVTLRWSPEDVIFVEDVHETGAVAQV
jgi:ABC-type Fe3+/spermidine/putrescine transport system ATPase subunit